MRDNWRFGTTAVGVVLTLVMMTACASGGGGTGKRTTPPLGWTIHATIIGTLDVPAHNALISDSFVALDPSGSTHAFAKTLWLIDQPTIGLVVAKLDPAGRYVGLIALDRPTIHDVWRATYTSSDVTIPGSAINQPPLPPGKYAGVGLRTASLSASVEFSTAHHFAYAIYPDETLMVPSGATAVDLGDLVSWEQTTDGYFIVATQAKPTAQDGFSQALIVFAGDVSASQSAQMVTRLRDHP